MGERSTVASVVGIGRSPVASVSGRSSIASVLCRKLDSGWRYVDVLFVDCDPL